MIDHAAIMHAVGQIITASGSFPRILWPNRDGLPEKPFLILELRPKAIRDETLRQTAAMWSGEIIGTVVTDLNRYETEGQALVGDLAALFPSGTRLTITGGAQVLVQGHPQPKGGYRDGADYRLQLSIPLQSD